MDFKKVIPVILLLLIAVGAVVRYQQTVVHTDRLVQSYNAWIDLAAIQQISPVTDASKIGRPDVYLYAISFPSSSRLINIDRDENRLLVERLKLQAEWDAYRGQSHTEVVRKSRTLNINGQDIDLSTILYIQGIQVVPNGQKLFRVGINAGDGISRVLIVYNANPNDTAALHDLLLNSWKDFYGLPNLNPEEYIYESKKRGCKVCTQI